MKQQGKQTKRGTSQKPVAAKASVKATMNSDNTKLGVAKPGEQPDRGHGATDFHQSNHGRRSR